MYLKPSRLPIMPPMRPALVNEVHRQGRMDDHLISTTKMVDANELDVWFLVFEYKSGWKTWSLGQS